jgi:pantoate kinase
MQADVERFLARLLTDPGLRERFLADRSGIAKEAGLSPEEAEAMARMPSQDLRTAARSYQHKRDANGPPRGRNWIIDWFRAKRR